MKLLTPKQVSFGVAAQVTFALVSPPPLPPQSSLELLNYARPDSLVRFRGLPVSASPTLGASAAARPELVVVRMSHVPHRFL